MRDLTATELARMRSTSVEAMFDKCKILAHSRVYDAWNSPQDTYTPGVEIACGYLPKSSDELRTDELTQVTYDALVRLPLGTTLDGLDRIEITEVKGVEVSFVYGVLEPMVGTTCLIVPLEKIST